MPRFPIALSLCVTLQALTLPAVATAPHRNTPAPAPPVASQPPPGEAPAAANVALRPVLNLPTPSGRLRRFAQLHQGLPVLGRGVSVRTDTTGRTTLSFSRLADQLPQSVAPSLSPAQAAAVAASLTGLPVQQDRVSLVLWPSAKTASLAFAVVPSPPTSFPYAPLVIVDAHHGRILHVDAGVRYKNAARVFALDPVRSPTPIDVLLPVADNADGTLQSEDTIAFNCVDRGSTRRITLFGTELDAHVCDLEQTATADPVSGDFTQHVFEGHDLAEDTFAEVSAFHHLNAGLAYFRKLLPALAVRPLDQPLWMVSNVRFPAGFASFDVARMADPSLPLEPFRNAAYYGLPYTSLIPILPLRSVIFLGQGRRVDASYDASVVYHELTHAVVRELGGLSSFVRDREGLYCAPGAIEEGLADYFAAAITGRPEFAPYFFSEFPDYDLSRSVDTLRACPAWLTGKLHTDSMLFSGALWETRLALPSEADRASFDQALLESVASLPAPDVSFEEMGEILLATVSAAPASARAASSLARALERRGLLGCSRVLPWLGQPLRPPGVDAASTYLAVGLGGEDAPFAPGFFQARVEIPRTAKQLRLQFSVVPMTADTEGTRLGVPTTLSAFSPAFLVRFDAPIEFVDNGEAWTPEGAATLDANRTGNHCEASLRVPQGASVAYVMVINRGDQSAEYAELTFETVEDGSPVPGDAGPSAAHGGCTCRASHQDRRSTRGTAISIALALGLLGLCRSSRRSCPRLRPARCPLDVQNARVPTAELPSPRAA